MTLLRENLTKLMKTIPSREFLFFTGILVIYFILSAHTISQQPQNVHWDYAVHLNNSFTYIDLLNSGDYSNFFTKYFFYPPLIYWFHSLLSTVIGYSRLNSVLVNFTFILLLLNTIYFFLRKQLKRDSLLLFLSLTLLNVNLTFSLTKPWELMLDLPQLCLIISISCVIYSFFLRPYTSQSRKILQISFIGILNGFLLLTKWTGPLFVLIPNLWLGIQLINSKKPPQILLLTLPSLYFFYLWYYPNLSFFLKDALFYSYDISTYEKDPQFIASLISYLSEYLKHYWLFITVIISIALILLKTNVASISEKKTALKNSVIKLLFAQMLLPLIFFSFVISNHDTRYIIPIFFGFNLCLAFGLSYKIKNTMIIKTATVIATLCGFIQFFYLIPPASLNKPLTDRVIQTALDNKLKTIYYFFENDSIHFNYANTELAHKENNYFNPNNFLEYKKLNDTEINLHQKKSCNFFELDLNDKTLIVVFSNEYTQSVYSAQFKEECSTLIPYLSKLSESFTLTQGKITTYKIIRASMK